MRAPTQTMLNALSFRLMAKGFRLTAFPSPLTLFLPTLARTPLNHPIFSNLQPRGWGVPPPNFRGSNFQTVLNLKLPQMMVEMLIHQRGPFDRSERPKEEVRMLRAYRGAAGHEAVDGFAEALAFHGEIAFVGYEAAFLRRRIAAHGLALHQQRLLHQRPKQASKEDSRRYRWLPHRQIECGRAVRQSLCGIHRAPLALAIRLQPRQPLLHFFHPCRIKEIFHVERRPPTDESNGGDANRQPGRKIIVRGGGVDGRKLGTS